MDALWSWWTGQPNQQEPAPPAQHFPSTKQEPEPLTYTPWRKTKGWDKKIRNELKDRIASLAPQTTGQLEVPFFNIALTGQIGAGKSSFFNSLNSIYQEGIVAGKAKVGIAAESLTNKFRMYEIKPNKPNSTPLPWRICDTMGLEPGNYTDYDVTNILKAVDGHIPDRFQLPKHEIIQENTSGYKPLPELKDKAHCVAVVIDGHGINQMSDTMKRKLRNLRTALIARDIPTYILITHIDEECVEINKDVSKVYRSVVIRDLVQKVGKMLHGLPENQIFPIVNYKEQVELEDTMDILLLYALRQMLYSAQGHLENKM